MIFTVTFRNGFQKEFEADEYEVLQPLPNPIVVLRRPSPAADVICLLPEEVKYNSGGLE